MTLRNHLYGWSYCRFQSSGANLIRSNLGLINLDKLTFSLLYTIGRALGVKILRGVNLFHLMHYCIKLEKLHAMTLASRIIVGHAKIHFDLIFRQLELTNESFSNFVNAPNSVC